MGRHLTPQGEAEERQCEIVATSYDLIENDRGELSAHGRIHGLLVGADEFLSINCPEQAQTLVQEALREVRVLRERDVRFENPRHRDLVRTARGDRL